ncbi:MAG: hypothetical protein KIC38_03745 [Actinomycetaceae bacterium]|nr:hypothetical protein [Actinomycetaceae bacterium]
MKTDPKRTITNSAVTITADTDCQGLTIYTGSDTEFVADIPLNPMEMLQVAEWLVLMAGAQDGAADTLEKRMRRASGALCAATTAINGAPLPPEKPEVAKRWQTLQRRVNAAQNAHSNLNFLLMKEGNK